MEADSEAAGRGRGILVENSAAMPRPWRAGGGLRVAGI